MTIVLSGSNTFNLKSELDNLGGEFKKTHGDLAFEVIDADEAELDKIKQALVSVPFLASKKMIVLKNPGSKKEFSENIETLLNGVPDTTDLIIYEPKIDKRTVYYKTLKKLTDFNELNELDENSLIKWVVELAKNHDGEISTNDARFLIERAGTDQNMLHNEVQKLISYSPKITKESIELLTPTSPKSTIFELLDAAFAGKKRLVMDIYEEQRMQKVEAQQIIAMLAWQLHILAVIMAAKDKNDGTIAKEAKINPYVVQKSRRLTNSLSPSKLKGMIADLAEIDSQSKSMNINIEDALKTYLLNLS